MLTFQKKQGTIVEGVLILSPEELEKENKDNILVINFGHSSQAIQSINNALSDSGFRMGYNYIDFAEFVKRKFKLKAENILNKEFSENNFTYARAFNFNSNISLETTVLGNWLLLELLIKTSESGGAIAEIGAYKGGNSYLLLCAMNLWNDPRKYYIFDSFKGFPELTDKDPVNLQGVYNYDYNLDRILNLFTIFRQSKIIPGFIPEAFKGIDDSEKFSLVFFDCDLYQPAIDTYNYFWNRIERGGILVIHDNIATKGGWSGVRKATEEFFNPKEIKFYDFWETTMSIIIK